MHQNLTVYTAPHCINHPITIASEPLPDLLPAHCLLVTTCCLYCLLGASTMQFFLYFLPLYFPISYIYYSFTGISTQHLYCPFRTPTTPLLPVLAAHCKYNPITATSTSLTIKLLSLLLLTFHSLYCLHTVSTTPLLPSLLHYPCPIQTFTTPSLLPFSTTPSLLLTVLTTPFHSPLSTFARSFVPLLPPQWCLYLGLYLASTYCPHQAITTFSASSLVLFPCNSLSFVSQSFSAFTIRKSLHEVLLTISTTAFRPALP